MTTRRAVTVSGSFHRAMDDIAWAVGQFTDAGATVLSPADPRLVEAFGDFWFVASDRMRTIALVQQRHLEAISASDLLWLACPDGYVGLSAAMELGRADADGVPVYASTPPADLTMRAYVRLVPGPREALADVATHDRTRRPAGILVDPHASIEQAHDHLEALARDLIAPADPRSPDSAKASARAAGRLLRGLA